MDPLIREIAELKAERDAVILAHYYEDDQIQDIADRVGDSLYLAQEGQKLKSPVILLAGVVFMAESVKILSPEKTVLVPDLSAGCSLVEGSPYHDYLNWRRQHPDAICVTYINSSAAVKAISDVICTSSNALKIIHAIPPERPILFGPDQNLGRYLAQVTGRNMTLWPGSCEVHVLFSAEKLVLLKQQNPGAVVLAHPECEAEVLRLSDVIGSTSHLLAEVTRLTSVKTFIVATEPGILHQMRKARPDARLIEAPSAAVCGCNNCPYMKMNTLEKIRRALHELNPAVSVDPGLADKARISLQRMMEVTAGQSVTWPSRFTL